jgi:hypothetical protein
MGSRVGLDVVKRKILAGNQTPAVQLIPTELSRLMYTVSVLVLFLFLYLGQYYLVVFDFCRKRYRKNHILW